MKKHLTDFYLSYVNEYLTVASMAEDHGISEEECGSLIELGRKYHEDGIHKYVIVYVRDGNTLRETIKANDWVQAKDICKRRGEFVSCIYVD